jgi:YVTN family beta-propeller protein
VIDVAEGAVVATVVTGKGAHGVVVSPDGRRAFVTNIRDSTVSAIDTATRAVVASYPVGAGPNGITYGVPPR